MNEHREEFGSRFIRERADEIDVDGKRVLLRKKIPSVQPGSTLSIRFESFSCEVEQALCLATTHGSFKLEGHQAKRIVLWAASTPREVKMAITNRIPADVIIWNAWRRFGGGIDAGLRYAGMIEEIIGESSWRLSCSDGVGGPDFSDLVVRVDLNPAK